MRLTRSSTLEVMRQDYIRTARGKGLDHRDIMITHSLKNALIPIITMVGLSSAPARRSMIIEPFSPAGNWQTADRLHLSERYPVIQGTVLFITLIICF
jgi:peptide/nickel transport system permease protein